VGSSVYHSRAETLGGLQLMLTEIVRGVGQMEIAGPLMRVGSNAFAGHVHLSAQAGKR
jgi:hypothetical protein